MKKKFAFFLMILVIAAALFYGMGRTQADEREKIQNLYKENYDISIESAVTDSVDKANNLIKLANKYASHNSELEVLAQGLDDKIKTLFVGDSEMAEPQALKEVYALAGNLANELVTVTANTSDEKYPGNLLAEITALRDRIGHAEYNEKAKEWNKSQSKFPKSLFKSIQIGSEPIFKMGTLYEYGDF